MKYYDLIFNLTAEMKEYLRCQMVLTSFEIRQRLKAERLELQIVIAAAQQRLNEIDAAPSPIV